MSLEFLWTDVFFLLLLGIGSILVLMSLRKQPIRRSFLLILSQPVAVSAGIVLLVFLFIGVLDSIHIRWTRDKTQHSETLLDSLLSPLGNVYEKTFSAPMALRSFVSEIQWVDGKNHQIYPRL